MKDTDLSQASRLQGVVMIFQSDLLVADRKISFCIKLIASK